jgi:hypothetical protein
MVSLLFALGAVLLLLLLLIFYRSALESYEYHRIFLDDPAHIAGLPNLVIVRMEKLDLLIKSMFAISSVLFLAIVILGLGRLLDFLKLVQATANQ